MQASPIACWVGPRLGMLATSFGSNSLEYDAANKWVSGTVSNNVLVFTYDGLGRRVSRTDDGARNDYWYYRTGLTMETMSTSSTPATFLRDPDGRLLSRNWGPHTNYGLDRQGSVTAMTEPDQSLSHSYRYTPYGENVGTTGSRYNPMRHTGTYLDTMTGLYQMGARYYQEASPEHLD